MSLSKLPRELALMIASYLAPKELNSFLQVNHGLADLLTSELHKLARYSIDGIPSLSWAAKNGHEPLVRVLLNTPGVDPGRHTCCCDIPLYQASKNGHTAIAALLCSQSGVHGQKGRDIINSFHCAARNGHSDIVQLMISHGVPVNHQYNDRCTALRDAASYGHDATVRLLLSHGADDSLDMTQGYSAFELAATGGHSDVLSTLLDHNAENSSPHYLNHALGLVSVKGSVDAIGLLVSRGANIDETVTPYGNPLLHHAASYDNVEVLETLLELGANIDLQSDRGETVVMVAHDRSLDATACLLLDRGANVFTKGSPRSTYWRTDHHWSDKILSWITAKRCPLFVARVLDKLLDIDGDCWSTIDDVRIFFEAVWLNHTKLVSLLASKVGIDCQNPSGETALHVATVSGSCISGDMVRVLLDMGANPFVRDNLGFTALDSVPLGQEKIGDLLRAAMEARRLH